jgi:hypothetical protein
LRDGQSFGKVVDALADLQQDVRDGLEQRWNAINRPALPPFCACH